MGVFPLADLAKCGGFRTEIIHMGVENFLDVNFSLEEYVVQNRVKLISFSLFWFHQSFDVLDLAMKIKKASSDTFIVLGGLTASYYAEELLTEYWFIDAVNVGYGEVTIIPLLNNIINNSGSLSQVPNLYYRLEGRAINSSLHVIDQALFHELNYTNLNLLRNYSTYVKFFGLHEMPLKASLDSLSKDKIMNETIETKMFPLAVGRGCNLQCSYCGGNKNTCRNLYGEDFLLWRSHEDILQDIDTVLNYGYTKVFICFDPSRKMQIYYVELFQKIRERNKNISMYFECWCLPTKEFIDQFQETFPDKDSHLLVSVDTFSEHIRKINQINYVTNEDFIEIFDYLEQKNVRFDLCFSIGLPGSTIIEDMKTYEDMKKIKKKYRMLGRLNTFLIDLVPGSSMYEMPEQYGVEVGYRSFKDFYREFSDPLHTTYALCNYKLKNYFNDERDIGTISDFANKLQLIKCKYFCGINEMDDPYNGKEGNMKKCVAMRQDVYDEMGLKIEAEEFDDVHTYSKELEKVRLQYHMSRMKYK